MKRREYLLIFLLIVTTIIVRLYRFNNPIADWHSWRQADTSSVSRNFVKYGFDLLHPRMNNISNVQSGLENPKGYFFTEFPLYNATQAGLYLTFHHFTIEEWGRIVSIFSSVLSAIFLFGLGKRYGNSTVGFVAATFFALDPYSIYYGRVILPDPSMTMAVLGSIFFFGKYTDNGQLREKFVWYTLSLLFTILALLLKPFAIFFLLPLIYLAFKKWQWKLFLRPELYIFAILSFLPLGVWRWWESKFPEGIPANAWLFNGGNIRFTGAYFYWIFAERISKLILGYWGISVVVIGLFTQVKKNFGFFLSFLFSSLIYVVVIARGNVQHDYYQILIIPTIALFFGLGVEFIISSLKAHVHILTRVSVLGVVCLFVMMFGWYQVRDYFNINNPSLIVAGQAVDRLTPKDALVIAPLDGDSSFLYQTNRQGWASFEKPLPQLIQMGADYLVLVNPTTNDQQIGKQYKILSQSSQYILFNLHQKP